MKRVRNQRSVRIESVRIASVRKESVRISTLRNQRSVEIGSFMIASVRIESVRVSAGPDYIPTVLTGVRSYGLFAYGLLTKFNRESGKALPGKPLDVSGQETPVKFRRGNRGPKP